MIEKRYIIHAPDGLHARPATALVKLTKQFRSRIFIKKEEALVNLNSLLNILSLGMKGGDTLTLLIDGEDETNAAEALDRFFMEQMQNL
jgi:phosphocarrier protein HPr